MITATQEDFKNALTDRIMKKKSPEMKPDTIKRNYRYLYIDIDKFGRLEHDEVIYCPVIASGSGNSEWGLYKFDGKFYLFYISNLDKNPVFVPLEEEKIKFYNGIKSPRPY